jgi:hypothetical protein
MFDKISNCWTRVNSKRRALPVDITHALPSLFGIPLSASPIRLVKGPSLLAKTVMIIAGRL